MKEWKALDAKNPADRERRFLFALRNLKKDFSVEVKKYTKAKIADLDGRSALELFRLANINVEKINSVPSGGSVENTIHLDTGNKEGFVITYPGLKNGDPYVGQPITAYFDHHGADSKRGTSATKYVYDTLIKLGVLDKSDKSLAKAVTFITQEDNRSYPNEEKYYKDSPNNLLGLSRYISFNSLYEFFKDGLSPTQKLTSEQIKKYGLEKAHEIQQRIVEKTEPTYKKLEKEGFVINSKDYGKVLVDIGGNFGKTAGGFVGAKAMGARAYVLWNPGTSSFMLSSADKDFPEKLLPQGKRLRQRMWIQDKREPLRMRLDEVMRTLVGRDFRMNAKMQEALKKAEAESKKNIPSRQAA